MNRKGFTLIEIMVVVVVLAVLMAVSVPSVLKYLHEADEAKMYANAHAFYNAVQTVAVKEYASGDAYSSGDLITYEAISSKGDAPDPSKTRIRAIYDLLVDQGLSDFKVIALVEKGNVTKMRYADLASGKVFKWDITTQKWERLEYNRDPATSDDWVGGDFTAHIPNPYRICWNGY